jgi:hypothetical protein
MKVKRGEISGGSYLRYIGVVVSFLLIWSTMAFAQEGTAGALKLGTTGLGVEVIQSFREHVNGRLGLNFYSGDYDATGGDEVEYDIDLNLRSGLLLVDWHPYEGEFRVSYGLFYNSNSVEVRGTPTESVKIGDRRYSPAEVGILKYTFDFRNIAPYLGIGVGNAFRTDRTFGFNFDFGLLFQGSPKVELSTEDSLVAEDLIRSDLEKEEEELEDDISAFKVYPVISFGFTYRFR